MFSSTEMCINRVKNMQADLAERDSLIRVLQHHSSLSRASSISSLLASSPRLSPQQQHRSPASLVLHAGSKPSSGASSRQGSQLSTGSLSLNKTSKLGSFAFVGSFRLSVILFVRYSCLVTSQPQELTGNHMTIAREKTHT